MLIANSNKNVATLTRNYNMKRYRANNELPIWGPPEHVQISASRPHLLPSIGKYGLRSGLASRFLRTVQLS